MKIITSHFYRLSAIFALATVVFSSGIAAEENFNDEIEANCVGHLNEPNKTIIKHKATPAVFASFINDEAVTVAAFQNVPFNTEVSNVGGGLTYDPTTNIFTVTKNGNYLINFSVQTSAVNPPSDGFVGAELIQQRETTPGNPSKLEKVGSPISVKVNSASAVILKLRRGDQVRVRAANSPLVLTFANPPSTAVFDNAFITFARLNR